MTSRSSILLKYYRTIEAPNHTLFIKSSVIGITSMADSVLHTVIRVALVPETGLEPGIRETPTLCWCNVGAPNIAPAEGRSLQGPHLVEW